LAAAVAVVRAIDNKIIKAWRGRFTKTPSCHVLAMRVKGINAPVAVPWGANESRRIRQILRLFIGDTPTRALIDDDAINRA
jgi:hypothetical protein